MSINPEISTIYTQPLSSIDWGSDLSGSNITYAFGGSGTSTTFSEEYTLGEGFTGESWTAYEQNQFRAVFDMIEEITNLTFTETGYYPGADLRLLVDTNEFFFGDLGVMIPPGEFGAGLGVFNGAFWDRGPGGDLEMGGFSFTTVVHELLHGMGLAHPHDYGGTSGIMTGVFSAFDDYGSYDLNQGVFTAMTYNTGLHTGNVGGYADPNEFDFGYEAAPMALDIAVLQDKYGANMSHATGNDIYDLFGSNSSGTHWASIWDAGGTDTIRYQGSLDVTIDLREATLQNNFGGGGYLSAADGIMGGFTIANGVVIERAQAGGGDDMLQGNAANNILNAGSGNDTLEGGNGNDTLNGGFGNDTMEGGANNDRLNGGTGSDRLLGEAGNDYLQGDDGNDTMLGANGNDTLNGGNGNDTMEGGANNDTLNGGGGSDTQVGGDGDDRINGDAGNDFLYGGNGNDIIAGGGDQDLLRGKDGNDEMLGGNGVDTLYGGNGFDTLEGGEGADRLQGDGGDDQLYGDGGNDTIFGNAGNDNLRGDGGNDRVVAGRGDDTVNGDSGNDEVNGGNGNDRVYGSAGTDTLFGGKGNDTIKDNDGDGVFYGNKGNDRMDGGAGADRMFGGNGNDTIISLAGNDTITGNSGFDTFIFYDGFDQDRITDHSGGDRLRIDDALLSGQTTGAAVVAQFGAIQNGHYVLDFGGGDKLWLEGVTNLAFLENSIDIF